MSVLIFSKVAGKDVSFWLAEPIGFFKEKNHHLLKVRREKPSVINHSGSDSELHS